MTRKRAEPGVSAAKYIVLVGDIVSSRKLKANSRRTVQEQFAAMIERLNRNLASELVAKLTITLGDEFEAVIRPEHAHTLIPDLIWTAEQEVPTVSIRFGVGLGAIDTAISANPLTMDGSAFHAARAAIEHAAEEGKMGGVFVGFGNGKDTVLNGIARVLHHQRESWSTQQRRVADLLRSGKRQSEAAVALKVTKQAVSSYARAAGWEVYAEGEAAWRIALQAAVMERGDTLAEEAPLSANQPESRDARRYA